ncbi:MAG: starch synthase [Deltaproteobacteria bacterium GWC2_42_11]|nr:MAG: starch synthase [Deltaproteobacteria bacterium GWC2_42_11]HBO83463.1 glycogen synthase GlgA [Deltaproteobacteria bacterium]
MKVLFVSSEAVPYAKTGGLGDVCGSLPKALKELGLETGLIIPFYRQIKEGHFDVSETGIKVSINISDKKIKAPVLKLVPACRKQGDKTSTVPTYFIKRDKYYDREYLYGTPEEDYPDSLERFTLFSRGVLESLKQIDFKPDIIHCHDWQTGLIPVYLKTVYKDDPFFSGIKTIFTIHNIAYQGLFPAAQFHVTGLPHYVFHHDSMEFWGRINILKGGIVFSDIITTVSEKYASEIQTKEFGCGLEGVLQARKTHLFGILNGVDYDEWNPSLDKFIAANYDKKDMIGKKKCRKDLLKEYNLNIPGNIPLIGIISRFVAQKGFDILKEAMDELMSMDIGMVILGTGDKKYNDQFAGFAMKHPQKLGVRIAFDNRMAHKVMAGCDMFLMPSRYEPCGMSQMYSLKYGTIPVVRATGGLDDTIDNFNPETREGNGFKFPDYSPSSLVEKVKEAAAIFNGDTGAWDRLIKKAMSADFSWNMSAARYVELYKSVLSL